VLGERRATSCLLFRPRSVLSVYSETSASHETVCLCPFPFPVPMRRIAIHPPLRFSCACLYLSICPPPRASPFSSIRLTLSPPFRYLASPRHLPRGPRLRRARAPLYFSFIKLIAPAKPKKHVVWGVTREYRVRQARKRRPAVTADGCRRSDRTPILTTLTPDRRASHETV